MLRIFYDPVLVHDVCHPTSCISMLTIVIYNTICNDAQRIFDYPVLILMMMVLGMDGGCTDGGGTHW